MTFEQFMGVDKVTPEWLEAKREFLAHLDSCPVCRQRLDCAEAVSLMSALTEAVASQEN